MDGDNSVGFFILRRPKDTTGTLRVGFVINDPQLRGKGYGKQMLQLAVKEAFNNPDVNQVTLGVFTNNPSAYNCYKAAGFSEIEGANQETFNLNGQEWTVLEMECVR